MIDRLNDSLQEAERFLDRARKLKAAIEARKPGEWPGVESGAMKRASLDLTRSLANLRRPQ